MQTVLSQASADKVASEKTLALGRGVFRSRPRQTTDCLCDSKQLNLRVSGHPAQGRLYKEFLSSVSTSSDPLDSRWVERKKAIQSFPKFFLEVSIISIFLIYPFHKEHHQCSWQPVCSPFAPVKATPQEAKVSWNLKE